VNPAEKTRARAVADLADGLVLATVEIAAPPARVFDALASPEVCAWWVRPGVFDTRDWTGEVRVGGRWRSSGVGGGRPYAIEGEFLEIDLSRRLAHTWQLAGVPSASTTVTYRLDRLDGGTRLTLRHSGLTKPQQCANTCAGWEASFARLAELVTEQPARNP
jgi:uncharacterized protein YndB with AHSA1/START domain